MLYLHGDVRTLTREVLEANGAVPDLIVAALGSPELSIRYLNQFFRCFRHAPLLAQIGVFAPFGLITGALVICGIGLAIGLLGRGDRGARLISVGCLLAGLLVWISSYSLAWWITERYPFSAIENQRCADQASASYTPAHFATSASPSPPLGRAPAA